MSKVLLNSWFAYVRDTRRECIDILFGRVVDGAVKWHEVSHSLVDGIAGFKQLHQTLSLKAELLSALREKRGWPGFRAFARLFRSPFYIKERQPSIWKSWNSEWTGSRPESTLLQKIAWRVFSSDETARVTGQAALLGVSLNSWLLQAANQGALSYFQELDADRPVLWMLPVSMRDSQQLEVAENRVVQVPVALRAGQSPMEVHRAVRSVMALGIHRAMDWGARKIVWLPGFILSRLMEHDLSRIYRRRTTLGGPVLSNLGEWKTQSAAGNAPVVVSDEAWVFCPTPLKIQPLGFGAIICNGRLGITLRCHSSLQATQAQCESAMESWVRAIQVPR